MILKKAFHKIILLITLALFSFISGCEEKEIVIPDQIIPKEKMVLVMADVHVAEAAFIHSATSGPPRSPEGYYLGIYETHQITEAQFEESYRFYVNHPELLKEVYGEVLIELSRQQAKAGN